MALTDMMAGMGREAGTAPAPKQIFHAGLVPGRVVAVAASFAALLASSPAFSLQVEGHEAFIVDRCGGDYDCKDVKLVVLNDKHDKADIYSGNEVNDHEADGTPEPRLRLCVQIQWRQSQHIPGRDSIAVERQGDRGEIHQWRRIRDRTKITSMSTAPAMRTERAVSPVLRPPAI